MEQTLEKLLEELREVSSENHSQGVGMHDVSDSLAEWYFGYSEGLDYAIEKIEVLLKKA